MSAKSYWLTAAEFSYCNWNPIKGRYVYNTSVNYKHPHSRREITVSSRDQISSVVLVLCCIYVNRKCTDVKCILTSETYNLKLETSRTILERLLNLDNSCCYKDWRCFWTVMRRFYIRLFLLEPVLYKNILKKLISFLLFALQSTKCD